jgi:hypothetical protein
VQVRGSFSCSPRFPSLWSEILFKQIHFLLGTIITAVATSFIVACMMQVVGNSDDSKSNPSRTSSVHGHTGTFLKPLRKAKGERLVFLGLVCAVLALGNLVVSVQTAPLVEHFRVESDERQSCLLPYILGCGSRNTCETEKEFQCSSHGDCLGEAEHCNTAQECKSCFLCAFENNGMGGACPSETCETSFRMSDRQHCAFTHCASNIASLASVPANVATVPVILSGGACDENCSELESDLKACVDVNQCSVSREDPCLQFEGCECTASEFGVRSRGGCGGDWSPNRYPVNPDKCLGGVEKWNSQHEEIGQLHVPQPSKTLNAEFGGVGGMFEIIRWRGGCCFDASPHCTRDEVCPPLKEVPNGEMIVGFFFLNCICLVGPLVFMATGAFKKGWSNMYVPRCYVRRDITDAHHS